jgi:hypothetical protein
METRKTLYSSMVHSHIMYCINIYSCANVSSLNKLKIKQKEAIRIICKVGFREHTAPLFVQLKILPLEELIKVNCLKFTHSFVHNTLTFSFRQLWKFNRERQPDRLLRNADQLCIPPHNFATLTRMPPFNFPRIWNLEGVDKFDPVQHRYLKNLKANFLLNLV